MASLEEAGFPKSRKAKKALLRDPSLLGGVCDAFVAELGSQEIGVRALQRAIAGIHRELALPMPGESAVDAAILAHSARGSTLSVSREEASDCIREVLKCCIQGRPLDGSAPLQRSSKMSEASDKGDAQEITVQVQQLSGTTVAITLVNTSTVEALSGEVEARLGIPTCLQQLVFGEQAPTSEQTLRELGANDGSLFTVVTSRPQALLLRSRRVQMNTSAGRPRSQVQPALQASTTICGLPLDTPVPGPPTPDQTSIPIPGGGSWRSFGSEPYRCSFDADDSFLLTEHHDDYSVELPKDLRRFIEGYNDYDGVLVDA